MAKDASVRAFKCPSCGAPLEPEVGTLTMKCPYCGGTVIIPESLRTPAPRSGPTMGEVFDFGLNGLDMNKIVGNAMQLPQAIQMAKQGRLDEAANIYSQITGMQHGDALKAVQAMADGHAVSLTPGQPGMTFGQFGGGFRQGPIVTVSPSAASAASAGSAGTFSSDSFSTGPGSTTTSSGGRSCGLLIGIIAAVVAVIVIIVGAGVFLFSGGLTGISLPGTFATKTLSFGAEGIGPGMFEDARSIGVDGNGNMTVADYQDGRIQTFDPNGKLTDSFSISEAGKKVYVTGMAVDRDGQIYVAHDWKIFIYKPDGTQVGQIADDTHRYNDVIMGGDGKLYAIANEEGIVRFNPDHSIDLDIPSTFATITNDAELDSHLAVDGVGNMYLVGSFNYLVLKYSPQGTFINRFGGQAQDAANPAPGKFVSPDAIAVDGYGRLYVSDFGDIKVFDSEGAYLNTININYESGVPFGMVFDAQNSLYTVTNKQLVMKFKVQAPASK